MTHEDPATRPTAFNAMWALLNAIGDVPPKLLKVTPLRRDDNDGAPSEDRHQQAGDTAHNAEESEMAADTVNNQLDNSVAVAP